VDWVLRNDDDDMGSSDVCVTLNKKITLSSYAVLSKTSIELSKSLIFLALPTGLEVEKEVLAEEFWALLGT
jgi:hypothetical protein